MAIVGPEAIDAAPARGPERQRRMAAGRVSCLARNGRSPGEESRPTPLRHRRSRRSRSRARSAIERPLGAVDPTDRGGLAGHPGPVRGRQHRQRRRSPIGPESQLARHHDTAATIACRSPATALSAARVGRKSKRSYVARDGGWTWTIRAPDRSVGKPEEWNEGTQPLVHSHRHGGPGAPLWSSAGAP